MILGRCPWASLQDILSRVSWRGLLARPRDSVDRIPSLYDQLHLDLDTDSPFQPARKNSTFQLYFCFLLADSLQEKKRESEKRLQWWRSFASLEGTLFMGNIYWQFQDTPSAKRWTPTPSEFKQISTMNTVMRNKVEVTQPKPIIMTSVALRARGLLALTCKSARQCAAIMLCR